MKRTISVSLLIFLLTSMVTAAAVVPRELMKIEHHTPEQLQYLSVNGYEIETVQSDRILIRLNPEELRKLEAVGIHPVATPDQAREMFLWLQENSRDDDPMRSWHTFSELEAELAQLAADYPALTRLYSIGQSVQGRDLWVLNITDNPGVDEDEPEFKYVSTMHGDEPVGTELLLNLAHLLLENQDVPRYQTIVNEIDFHILFLMNPDGYVNGTRENYNGVDLNRHFPDQFTDPNNTTTGREPEIARVMEWGFDHHFVQSANFHTGSLVVNYPYDGTVSGASTYSACPDDDLFIVLSETYSSTNLPMWNGAWPHGITNGAEWYVIRGGMQDWNYVWMGDMEVTIELNNVKWPDESVLPGLWDDNRESMLSYLEQCLTGIRGIVTDANTGLPLAATVRLTGVDHDMFSDPAIGDYHRICLPGTYDLEVSCEGYESATISGISVSSGDATVVDVALNPLPSWNVSGVVYDPSGSPLSGAVVNSWGDVHESTYTNGSGFYQLQLPAGDYTLTAGYTGMQGDSEVITLTSDMTVDFQLGELTMETFENGFNDFPWTSSGDAAWFIDGSDYYSPVQSARSGVISHNQHSTLTVNVETTATGQIQFWCRTSTESGYDYLRFYIDGTLMSSWSGSSDWFDVVHTVGAGSHSFEWRYEKDGSVSSGSDCVWIDDITFPALVPPAYPEIDLQPTSVSLTLAPGATGQETITISNSGDGVLNWSSGLSFPTRRKAPAIPETLELAKGEKDTRPGQAPARDSGGPDTFGYSWMDSNEPGGPLFDWVDATAGGTPYTLGDDDYVTVSLPFTFPFYGEDKSVAHINSNGYLSFSSTGSAYTNGSIPLVDGTEDLLAAFWDDLNPSAAGNIYTLHDVSPNRFIIQWNGVPHYGAGDPYYFQIILYETGQIEFQYQSMNGVLNSATIGIENSTGSDGLQVVRNADYVEDGLTVRFSLQNPPSWIFRSPDAGSVLPGGTEHIVLDFDATDLEEGIYEAVLTVESNDQDEPTVEVPIALTVEDVVIPNPVTDLTISIAGNNTHLAWSATTGTSTYLVYGSAEPYTGWQLLGEVSLTEFIDGDAVLSGRKFYRVVAIN